MHPLVEDSPEVHAGNAVHEGHKKVSCVKVLQAMHGVLMSTLSFHLKLKEDFEFNPCNMCVATRVVNGKQCIMQFHIDDPMSSHMDENINNEFEKWSSETCGECRDVTSTM